VSKKRSQPLLSTQDLDFTDRIMFSLLKTIFCSSCITAWHSPGPQRRNNPVHDGPYVNLYRSNKIIPPPQKKVHENIEEEE